LVDSLHPGEIDNTSLQGSYGDEMKRNTTEGKDYILLPNQTATNLFAKYNGGPQFPRQVLNIGTHYNPIYQVNLFPVRVEVYYCDKTQAEPAQTEERFMRRYFKKNMSLSNVGKDLAGMFQQNTRKDTYSRYTSPLTSYSNRYWLKDTPPIASSTLSKDGSRMLTCDVVDFDGDWRYVRNDMNRGIQEVLGDRDCIELIIESVPMAVPRDSDWPRFRKLENWKNSLQPGDMIDAKDIKNQFYAAKVKSVDENRNVHVHYLGWDSDHDEVIHHQDIHQKIQPLHSYSPDRSKWEEGDKLDVGIPNPMNDNILVWVVGTIVATDPKEEKIQVLVDATDKIAAFEAASKKKKASYLNDDDRLKKTSYGNETAAASIMEIDDAAVGSTAVGDAENKTETTVEEETSYREWHEVYSDNVSPIYTRTSAPRTKTVTSYSSGYGSSNYGIDSYSSGGYGLTSLYGNASYSYDRNTKGTPPVAGAVGLQNLGNTCFMNSILQCLSNTQILTEMFLSTSYKDQINYDNPLGHNGKIALVYGKLIKEIWSGAFTKVVPREFKTTIGEYRSSFAGYDQQDSQELLNCLLDGLHVSFYVNVYF
jgi:hypothetical protein